VAAMRVIRVILETSALRGPRGAPVAQADRRCPPRTRKTLLYNADDPARSRST
jgi:hypothetical protein